MAEEFGRNGGEREPPLDLLAATPGDIRPFLKWAAIIVGVVVLFGLASFGRTVYTDLLWFDSLGLRSIFVKVTVTRIALFAIGTAVAAVVIGVSLWLAHRHSAGEITLPVPSEGTYGASPVGPRWDRSRR